MARPLLLTQSHIDLVCEARDKGGSIVVCAKHAGVSKYALLIWLANGEILKDYVDTGNFFEPKHYKGFQARAADIIPKLKREIEQNKGKLTAKHKLYLKLINQIRISEDAVNFEALTTLDEAKNQYPDWALRTLQFMNPGEYLDPAQAALLQQQEDEREKIAAEAEEFRIPARLIGPEFLDDDDAINEHAFTEFVEDGGRGSTKSSFVSLEVVAILKNNPMMHALVMRQVKDTLRDSVFAQIQWAIDELGLSDEWKATTSPLAFTHVKTGQKIYFRGADESGRKIKSIKTPFGYIGVLWFEELDQYDGPESVRKIEQSAIRGGDTAYIFKTFNPPRSKNNWVNKYVLVPKGNQYHHTSTYLGLRGRKRWLGQVFLDEAEHLKQVNPAAYEHEYLGVPNLTGGLVFPNVELRAISDEEIDNIGYAYRGLDWGYALDPLHYVGLNYDAKTETIYIWQEFRAKGMGNRELAETLKKSFKLTRNDLIIADSAEPKSVDDMNAYGLAVRGAEKGPDSVRYSVQWLQSRAKIVIDPVRCPETSQEFANYEYVQTKDGEYISQYPDKDNHAIDAVRYALNLIWRRAGN